MRIVLIIVVRIGFIIALVVVDPIIRGSFLASPEEDQPWGWSFIIPVRFEMELG